MESCRRLVIAAVRLQTARDGGGKGLMKRIAALIVALSAAGFASAQTSAASDSGPAAAANPNARHIIGLDTVKRNAAGKLTVQDGALKFGTGNIGSNIPVASIDDVFIGTETTQAGGKKGRAVKIAAIASPYETGRVLPLLMRTKVDILTVSFHDSGGALHGAVFALPIGQAEQMRAQLIQAGAHASSLEQ
jgi:hypothetical protein